MLLSGDNGIISRAMEASIKSKFAQYKEEAEEYIFFQISNDVEETDINLGGDSEGDIQKAIPSIDEQFKDRFMIKEGKLYYLYFPSSGEDGTEEQANYCRTLGIEVAKLGDFTYAVKGSRYSKVSSEDKNSSYYICTPDLSQFNSEVTYYVVYSSNGGEDAELSATVKSRVDKISTLTNTWYDYSSNKWANIITIGNSTMSFWVWVPRYAYKIAAESFEGAERISWSETVDEIETSYEYYLGVKYVDLNNCYYDSSGQRVSVENDWIVPDAFCFNGVNLGGYWMSKYEVQEAAATNNNISVTVGVNSISILNKSAETADNVYSVYIDDMENVAYTGTLKAAVKIADLDANSSHNLIIRDSNGFFVKTMTFSVLKKQTEQEIKQVVQVDLDEFSPEDTYYVLYNSDSSKVQLVSLQATQETLNSYFTNGWTWHNYYKKQWANIVTVGNGVITYWVWVPRYAYQQVDGAESVEVLFVSKSTDVSSLGSSWIVPESFEFDFNENGTIDNNEQLNGYWMSKYEVQEATVGNSGLVVTASYDNINVKTKSSTDTSTYYLKLIDTEDATKYTEVTINTLNSGRKFTTIGQDVNIVPSHSYKLTVMKMDGTNLSDVVFNSVVTTQVNPASDASVANITVNCSEFENSCTYYVLYDEDDLTATPIQKGFSEISLSTSGGRSTWTTTVDGQEKVYVWYDYSQKIYANIVTKAEETETWWVYIPRYKYKTIKGSESVDISFITTSTTNANAGSGWIVPEAFEFDLNGNNTIDSVEQLNGYWISKWEVKKH